jgi:membrane protease YdiL (CAAX protease family)
VTDWAAFAGFSVAVLSLLLVLSHLSASVGGGSLTPADLRWLDALADGSDHLAASDAVPPETGTGVETEYSTGLFVVNVTLSQGVLAVFLLGAVFFTQVPLSALGVSRATVGTGALVAGVGIGAVLVAGNALGAAVARSLGTPPSADLRELLTPESPLGWVLLLCVALPVVAGFEELLFRAILIGGFATGFGVSPWLLAAVSSVLFALGHGAQGPLGMAVTGVLGFALAAAFVLTGSLLAVVVAHYLVNAAEFVGHELLGSMTGRTDVG